MHRRGAPAVCFSVLASSVIIVAARAGLLLPCVVPTLGLRLIIQSVNEMPPAQIDGIVQGVYFALKRRGLNKIKVLPSFWFLRAKTRENGAFYGSRPAGNAGKPRVFIESNRQTGIWRAAVARSLSCVFCAIVASRSTAPCAVNRNCVATLLRQRATISNRQIPVSPRLTESRPPAAVWGRSARRFRPGSN
jgi:hypothetical protein